MNDEGVLVAFLAYLVFLLAVGAAGYRVSKSLSDFFLAGRKLGAWVVAISAQASDMSGWLLMGLPGAVIKHGVSMVWVAIGCAGGTLFNWTQVAKRLRRYSEILDALTVPEFLAARFHGRAEPAIRLLSLLTIVIFYSIYIAAQFSAAGKTLSATFHPLDYHSALCLSAAVILAYTMLGGFFAVAWTDLFQGLIMVSVVVVLPVLGLLQMGGPEKVFSALAEKGPEMVQVSRGFSGWDLLGGLVLGGLAWGLGYPGMPHITVRFMAIRDDRDLRRSALISMVWVVFALWGAMAVGAVGYAGFGDSLKDPETVIPVMARAYFPGLVAGVVISAIAAAIMSTVDSQLLVLGSAVVEDFYRKLLKREPSEGAAVALSRAATLAVGVAALMIAWNEKGAVFDYVEDAWSGLAAGFGPALVFSLKWKRTTGRGAAAGMAAGVLAVLVWRHVSALSSLIWELLPAFVLSSLVIVVVSLLDEPPGREVEAEFELAASSRPLSPKA